MLKEEDRVQGILTNVVTMIVGCPNYLDLSSTSKWLTKIVENKISRLKTLKLKKRSKIISEKHQKISKPSHFSSACISKKKTNLWIFFHKSVGLLHQHSGFAAMDTSWVGFKSMFQSTSWVTFHLGMFLWLRSAFLSLEINLKCVRGHIDIWGRPAWKSREAYQNLRKYFAYNKVLKMLKFSQGV